MEKLKFLCVSFRFCVSVALSNLLVLVGDDRTVKANNTRTVACLCLSSWSYHKIACLSFLLFFWTSLSTSWQWAIAPPFLQLGTPLHP